MTKSATEYYRKILVRSERMLASAQSGNWENLVEEAKAYEQEILGVPPATDSEMEQCAELIASILENDEKIKSLVKARMSDLLGALSSVSQSIKLNQAYR